MSNIGSTDPVLRDELILELIYKMIVGNGLNDQEIKEICRKLLKYVRLLCIAIL